MPESCVKRTICSLDVFWWHPRSSGRSIPDRDSRQRIACGELDKGKIVAVTFFSYWGKARPAGEKGESYHLLPFHCLDVAACGRLLLHLPQFSLAPLADELGWPRERVEAVFGFRVRQFEHLPRSGNRADAGHAIVGAVP